MTSHHLLSALALCAALQAQAGPGHDHGDEAPVSTGLAKPRFAATSELFELVGVLDGTTLTLYLDRAASNEPVPEAGIELELGGSKFSPAAQADGSYVVTLSQLPGDGVHAVTATVSVGEEVDLLAGEWALHLEAGPAGDSPPSAGKRWGLAAVLGGLGGAALLAWLRRQRSLSFRSAA